MDLVTILSAVGGLISGGGLLKLLHWSTDKKVAKAEAQVAEISAMKAQAEAYQTELKVLHEINANFGNNEKELSERISELNHSLNSKEDMINDKTNEIRRLNGELIVSEREINRVQDLLNNANERIIKLTEERDEERRLKEHYQNWHCRKSDCGERLPPNPTIRGKEFVEPEMVSESVTDPERGES